METLHYMKISQVAWNSCHIQDAPRNATGTSSKPGLPVTCTPTLGFLYSNFWADFRRVKTNRTQTFRVSSGHMGECIFIKSAWLFKKPETFVSKIAQGHWVLSILTGWIWLISGGLPFQGFIECIFIKSAWLFKKPETFVSKIAWVHWVLAIPAGWNWLNKAGLTVRVIRIHGTLSLLRNCF